MLMYLLTDSASYRPSAAALYLQHLQRPSSSSSTNPTVASATTQVGGADSSSESDHHPHPQQRPRTSVKELAKSFAVGCCAVDGAAAGVAAGPGTSSPQKRILSGSANPLRKSFTSTSSLYSPSVENLVALQTRPMMATHDHMDELVQDVIYAFMGAQVCSDSNSINRKQENKSINRSRK